MSTGSSVVRVGIGCFVKSAMFPGSVLIGKRKSVLGDGMLALPGGHLEIGESWAECAAREVKEETNLTIGNLQFRAVTNDIAIAGDPLKHYITIFMTGEVLDSSPPLENLEPDKCSHWEWISIQRLIEIYSTNPNSLFDPLRRFISENESTIIE